MNQSEPCPFARCYAPLCVLPRYPPGERAKMCEREKRCERCKNEQKRRKKV